MIVSSRFYGARTPVRKDVLMRTLFGLVLTVSAQSPFSPALGQPSGVDIDRARSVRSSAQVENAQQASAVARQQYQQQQETRAQAPAEPPAQGEARALARARAPLTRPRTCECACARACGTRPPFPRADEVM